MIVKILPRAKCTVVSLNDSVKKQNKNQTKPNDHNEHVANMWDVQAH